MKVVLVADVPNLGRTGDVKTVADGYARNYLIPRGLAVVATEGALKQREDLRKAENRRRKRSMEDARDLAEAISRLSLTFRMRVGETERLYGSITSTHIAEAIEKEIGKPIDRRKIVLDEPIKSLGIHQVPIRLVPEVVAEVTVVVEKEEGD